MGQATQRISVNPGQPGQPAPIPAAPVTSTSNLNERLTVDPSSNALWFRGREDETRMVADLLHLVDVANALVSRFYPVGLSTAEAVANAGTKEQLGGYFIIEAPDLDAALDWAARSPSAAYASTEVRPVLPPPPNAG